jgi:hypothetical protein
MTCQAFQGKSVVSISGEVSRAWQSMYCAGRSEKGCGPHDMAQREQYPLPFPRLPAIRDRQCGSSREKESGPQCP